MSRHWNISTFVAVLVSALVVHTPISTKTPAMLSPGGGADSAKKMGTRASKQETPAAVSIDAQTCFPFEILLRQEGIEEHPWSMLTAEEAHAKNGGLVCSALTPGKKQKPTPPSRPTPPQDVFSGQILIATVPNPLETSDSLEFDRAIAALQEAGSAAGYDFERIATPWEISDLQEPKDLKEGREYKYYRRAFGSEPGAMLFHCKGWPDDCDSSVTVHRQLLLLLVPESPTYGLNMHAATEALAAYNALIKMNLDQTNETVIRWIGPEYSSSAGDLSRLKEQARKRNALLSFCALSGSLSSTEALDSLKIVNGGDRSCGLGDSSTLAALDSEALADLLTNSAYHNSTVGILSEDETAYGSQFTSRKSKAHRFLDQSVTKNGVEIRRFTFPRGISHVRGMYGRQLRDPGSQVQQEGNPTANGIMDFADALQQPSDTPEEFAAQSPISNESILASIASSVRQLNAQTVVILATDPLDQIFLARYFHRNLASSRVVLLNADELLPRLRSDFNLDGTIVVSRFPLFPDSYLTLPYPLDSRRSLSFASSAQEGVFLAALGQIRDASFVQSPKAEKKNVLGLWIGVSGSGQFWPVAHESSQVLNESDLLTLETREVPGAESKASQAAKRADCQITAKRGKDHKKYTTVPVTGVEENTQERHGLMQIVDTPNETLPKLWAVILSLTMVCSFVHFVFVFAALKMNRSKKRLSPIETGSVEELASPGVPELLAGRKEMSGRERALMRLKQESEKIRVRIENQRSRIRRHRILSYYFLFAERGPECETPSQTDMVFYLSHCWWLMNVSVIFLTVLVYLVLPAIVYRGAMNGHDDFFSAVNSFLFSYSSTTRLFVWSSVVMIALQSLLVICFGILSVIFAWSVEPPGQIGPKFVPLVSIVWASGCIGLYANELYLPNSGWLFALRCLHLESGVCPILPLLLISVSLLAIAMAFLNSIGLRSTRDPGCPLMPVADYLAVEEWSNSMRRYMHDWSGLPWNEWLLLILGLITAASISKPWLALATFDSGYIAALYCQVFFTAVYFAVLLAFKFWFLWADLRFGLEALEASPLRHAFSRLPDVFSPGPIWSYAGLRRQVILLWRGVEYLRISPLGKTRAPQPNLAMGTLWHLAEKIRNSEQFEPGDYQCFSKELNDYASDLSLLPSVRRAWDRGGTDLTSKPGVCCCCGEASSTAKGAHADLPPPCGFEQDDEISCVVARANEFIATRFAFYIRYVTFHLKNFMTFMSLSTLFLVLAAVSYPYDREGVVLRDAAIVLSLILLVVAWVLRQMDRDALLSRLTKTTPGDVNVGGYIVQLLAVGGLPVLTVLASIFPPLGNFVFSFARPFLQGLH